MLERRALASAQGIQCLRAPLFQSPLQQKGRSMRALESNNDHVEFIEHSQTPACSLLILFRVDIPRRLRRAILENDLPLVKRILEANPTYLQNPDPSDKANTSLHLAAQRGYVEIAVRPFFLSPSVPQTC